MRDARIWIGASIADVKGCSKLPRRPGPGQVTFLHRTVKDFLGTGVLDNMRNEIRAKHARSPTFNAHRAIAGALLIQTKTMQAHTYEYSLMNNYVCDLCKYAGKYEVQTGQPLIDLLDSLDKIGTEFYKKNKALCRGDHWTQLLDNDDGPAFSPETCDTFMTYALKHNLSVYFREKFLQAPATALQKPGRPLLDYVLRPHGHGKDIFSSAPFEPNIMLFP